MKELIAEKQSYVDIIRKGKQNIAQLKKDKALKKAPLWEVAQGTVDAKKDYIKSMTADLDADILREEANIEYAYNMIDVVNDKMVYLEDE